MTAKVCHTSWLMYDECLEQIKLKLERLRELDPQGIVLFGARYHQYRLNPPAGLNLVERYEEKFAVSIPAEYREFIIHLGNGGAGPYYGLWPIHVPDEADYETAEFVTYHGHGGWVYDENYPMFEKVEVDGFSADVPYRGDGVTIDYDQDTALELPDQSLIFGAMGCDLQMLLVCSGPNYGEVWQRAFEDRICFNPISPLSPTFAEPRDRRIPIYADNLAKPGGLRTYDVSPFTLGGAPMTFLDWYDHWLAAGLRWFEE